ERGRVQQRRAMPRAVRRWLAHLLPSPAREARGGEGSGVGAPRVPGKRFFATPAHEQAQSATRRSAASLRRSSLPANGREGRSGEAWPTSHPATFLPLLFLLLHP